MSHLPDVYAIVNINDLNKVNFSQVGETSENTIRLNMAETKFVLKWEHEHEPTFISDGSVVPLQTLTHEEALALMNTSEWSDNTII